MGGKRREGKGREGKGREWKGREGKGREGKGSEGKGREGREGKVVFNLKGLWGGPPGSFLTRAKISLYAHILFTPAA